MHRIRSFVRRLLNLFRRSKLEADLREQIESHQAMVEADLIDRGMPPDGARVTARKSLGNSLLVRELSTDQMGFRLLHDLGRDVRYAIRSFLWNPQFSVVAILTMALGVGVNVAVFSAVDLMLFRPLGYKDADRIVVMGEHAEGAERPYGTLDARYVVEARRRHQGFEDVSVTLSFGSTAYFLTQDPDESPIVRLMQATSNTLKVFGVAPTIGRDFTADDARQNLPLVLISFEAWQSKLGGDPKVVGRTLWSSGARARGRAEIIGVLPPGFIPPSGLSSARVDGLALGPNPLDSASAQSRSTPAYVRLKPGVSIATAEAELAALVASLREADPPRSPGRKPTTLRLTPVRTAMFGRFDAYAWLVIGAASLVLLVACANLASLLLVRGRSRERITAMQVALGASSWRVMRAAAVESLAIAASGGAMALLVLWWAMDAVRLLLPPPFDLYAASLLDLRVLVFALMAATGSALAAVLLPAFRYARFDVLSALQGADNGTRFHWLRSGSGLLFIEAAIGVLLVAGAASTSRSLIGLLQTDLGYDPSNLQEVSMLLPKAADPESNFAQYQRALDVLRRFPGVRAAAGANVLSIWNGANGWTRFGKGYDEGSRWHVTGDYFETVRQPLLAGRTISAGDVSSRARVAVLSQAALRMVWPGLSSTEAVGRLLRFQEEAPIEVIGVVADLRPVFAATPAVALYLPIAPDTMRTMSYVVQMTPGHVLPTRALRERIRQEVGEPSGLSTNPFADQIQDSLRTERFQTVLFATFAVIALVSAAVGLYGVCAFEVASRRREFGIRLALGGTPRDLRRLVLRQTLAPAFAGVGAGLALSYWAAKFLQSFLHQVDARDPWTLALVAGVLIVTAGTASWLPARRASGVDLANILRSM